MEGQVNGWIGRLDCRNMRLHALNTCFIIGLHCCHRPILWTHDSVLAVFCCHRPIPCTHDSTRATIRLKRRRDKAGCGPYFLHIYRWACSKKQALASLSALVAPPTVEMLNLWNDFRKVVEFMDENRAWLLPLIEKWS